MPEELVADGGPQVPLMDGQVLRFVAWVFLQHPIVGCRNGHCPVPVPLLSFLHDSAVVVADGQIHCPCAVPECCNQIPQLFVAQSGH